MINSALSSRRVVKFSRLRLGQPDQFFYGLRLKGWVNNNDKWPRGDTADTRKIGNRVIRQIIIERGTDRKCRGDQHDRVTVGRSLGHDSSTDGAGSTGSIVDDNRLAERSLIGCAIIRAMTSAPAPGGNGTTNRTGRDGNKLAWVSTGAASRVTSAESESPTHNPAHNPAMTQSVRIEFPITTLS